jgi:hypothetical protein
MTTHDTNKASHAFQLWHVRNEILCFMAESPRRLRAAANQNAIQELRSAAKCLAWIGETLDQYMDVNPGTHRGGVGVAQTGKDMLAALNDQPEVSPTPIDRVAALETQVARLTAVLANRKGVAK